jgi:hypothetical protein
LLSPLSPESIHRMVTENGVLAVEAESAPELIPLPMS